MKVTTNSTRVQAPASSYKFNLAARPPGLDEGSLAKPSHGPRELDRNANRENIFHSKSITSIATWNVRTLKTDESLGLLAREVGRYSCDIVGISETHRLETEEFNVQDYRFLGQGRTDGIHRSGVGFML